MNYFLSALNNIRKDCSIPMPIRLLAQRWYFRAYRYDGLTAAEIEEIAGACTRNAMARNGFPVEDCDLPNVLLKTMLSACEAKGLEEVLPNGMTRFSTVVAPRGLALSYAFEHYGKDPEWLLEALGYELTDGDDEEAWVA